MGEGEWGGGVYRLSKSALSVIFVLGNLQATWNVMNKQVLMDAFLKHFAFAFRDTFAAQELESTL